tara:strand:+ start:233 stop:418 length:186 start_codon:yes stop_codon:yes gene_type:complete
MKISDLVVMKPRYLENISGPLQTGIITNFVMEERWAEVLWSYEGLSLEKIRDLKVVNNENR